MYLEEKSFLHTADKFPLKTSGEAPKKLSEGEGGNSARGGPKIEKKGEGEEGFMTEPRAEAFLYTVEIVSALNIS